MIEAVDGRSFQSNCVYKFEVNIGLLSQSNQKLIKCPKKKKKPF